MNNCILSATLAVALGSAIGVATHTARATALEEPVGKPGQSSQPTNQSGTSRVREFSATYEAKHIASDTVLALVRIQIASHGVKVQQLMGSTGASFVLNSDSGQMWMIHDRGRVYHEVPIHPVIIQNDFNGKVNEDIASGAPSSAAYLPESVTQILPFIQFEPCIGLDGLMSSEVKIHGVDMQLWQCSLHGQVLKQQWFDVALSLITKEITEDGYLSEMLDLQQAPLSTEHFLPPANYNPVTVYEFMGKVAKLGLYQAE